MKIFNSTKAKSSIDNIEGRYGKMVLVAAVVGLGLAENLDAFALYDFSVRRILQLFVLLIISAILVALLIFEWKKGVKINWSMMNREFILLLVIVGWAIFNTLQRCEVGVASCLETDFYVNRITHWLAIFWLLFIIYYSALKVDVAEVDKIISKFTLLIGFIAVIYLADHFFVRFGFDIINRNGIGTSGDVVLNRFYYYEYHRLMGGFREPSLAAGFLIIALALTFGQEGVWRKVMLSAAIFLTGSILVYGILLCLVIFWILYWAISRAGYHVGIMVLSIILGAVLAHALSFRYSEGGGQSYLNKRISLVSNEVKECENYVGLKDAVLCRLESIPGRGYIFSYIADKPITVFGLGLVDPYYDLQHYKNSDVIPSFLSAAVALFYQIGVFGVMVLIYILISYFVNLLRMGGGQIGTRLAGAVLAICLVLGFLVEEPTLFMISIISISISIFWNHKKLRVKKVTGFVGG